jgi:hypothetical protein
MNYFDLRYGVFGVDERREARPMVIPFVSLVTRQTPEYTATLRAELALGASRCCKPLVVNDATARLASWAASQSDPRVTSSHS